MNGRWIQYVVLVIVLVAAVAGISWGWINGIAAAQSKQVLKDANALMQAFEYFHGDQNRYPTTDEFANQNIMRAYATHFPPQQFVTEACPQTFEYVNDFSQEYILRFCLPKGVSGYSAGWNEFIHKD